MATELTGLLVGFLFGAALFLGGLADPDKIIGTLRLKDLHAMRVIILFLIIGMGGVWILDRLGWANYDVKATTTITVLIGGALLGIGFGLTGYCPGTGLACAVSGRLDAWVTVLGMFAGALVYILIYPSVLAPLETMADLGKVTLPEVTGIPRFVWAICLMGMGVVALILTLNEQTPKSTGDQTG